MVSASDYQTILSQARRVMETVDDPARAFGALTDVMTRGRAGLIGKLLLASDNAVIRQGPFAGMRFHVHASEGCYVPKLLGCYESELHGLIASLPARGYQNVVDIGCAEGYYAVGLARLLPNAEIRAHDIDPKAREMVSRLAQENGVSDRVKVGGGLDHGNLGSAIQGRTLIFSDCEGAEYDLLSVAAVPALAQADMIVELHGVSRQPERARQWLQKMLETHRLQLIAQGARNPASIPDIAGWKHLDQLLAVWEFRGEPTPWAWLQAGGVAS